MDEARRRSIILAILIFIFGSAWGSLLIWMALDIVRGGDITWLDAVALHFIFLGYGTLFTLGER